MRYLQKFISFNEDVTDASPVSDDGILNSNDKVKNDLIKEIQSNITTFNQKKSVVDQIFDKSEDSKLEDDLRIKVYGGESDINKRNPYLKDYESICRLERSLKKIQLSIESDEDRSNDILQFVKDLKSKSLEINDKIQIEKISNQIKKNDEYVKRLQDNIRMNKLKLNKVNLDFDKKKKEFTSRIKIDSDRIKKYAEQKI